jgi:predicted amidohydrolase YtcJ
MATRLTTILVIVIVGATFIAGLIVGAQRDDASGPIDLIIVNGKVYTGGKVELQEAVAVRGNQILRVGSNREVKRLRRPQTVVLDAHGATVIPGMNDTRLELMSGALALEHLNLSPATTLDDVETELRHYAEEDLSRGWLIGRNGDSELFATANVAARAMLDDVADDRPIFVTNEDETVAWANSKALEMAAIDRRTHSAQAGTIVKDRRTGEPTGVLRGSAVDLVARVLPKPTQAEKVAALRAAIAEAHRVGITSVQTVHTSDEELRLLNEIRRQGDLTLRVYGSIAVGPNVTEAQVLEFSKLRESYPDDPTLKFGGIEIVCPCDAAQTGRAVALLDRHDWHVMVRTVSGADVRAAVEAFDHAAAGNPTRERRYRVDDTLLTEAGARLLFGSDWPAATLDPREAIEENVAAPGELRDAIDAYTRHAAYASYDEHRKGTLAPGMLADIVILSNDIFEDRPDAVKESAVTVTIFDGKVVYQRPTATSND